MFVKYKYQVYFDEKSGYSVCQYKCSDLGKTITCCGTNLPTIKNITYEFEVKEQTTGKYKGSYNVISFKEYVNKTKEDVIAYLSCGIFSGISGKTAEKIYEVFGENTLEILDNDIDRLIEVTGIGKKTLDKIKLSYIEKRASREIAEKLIKYGISVNACNRIYKKYKAEALNIIENNPYELCNIRGITFPMADLIGKDMNISDTDYRRIQAASNYVLIEDMAFGNVCMPKLDYANKLLNTLNTENITRKNITKYVLMMITDKTIRYSKRVTANGKEEYIYYPKTYEAEVNIAKNIRFLLGQKKIPVLDMDKLIDKHSKGIELDENQKKAVKMGVTEPLYVISGGPGTGKTTILKVIANINQELNKGKDNNIFLSPTGRAARRITESTGYPAKTIHSALCLGIIEDERFDVDTYVEEKKLEAARVIVDESSMIDLWTMDALLKNLSHSTLGLIGDVDQLPSVRCGSILRDLISSGVIPCVQLEHIHRQADDAINICKNARNIKSGIYQLNEGNDFKIIPANTLEEAENNLIDVALKEFARFSSDNVKVLCPFKKGFCGVYRVNNLLQNEINPSKGDLEVKIPNDMVLRVGDPVMQLRNIEDVSNGDIGYITEITKDEITVVYQDAAIDYSYADAKEQLILAYATTVHKSQGSEYDAVVMALTPQHGMMKRRNILYTGITRARHSCILIGSSFEEAIDNNMLEDRHSMLSEYINTTLNKEIVIKKEEKPEEKYVQMVLPFFNSAVCQ